MTAKEFPEFTLCYFVSFVVYELGCLADPVTEYQDIS
jgi:hypothetical protein